MEASKAAELATLNRNTLNRHYFLIRKCISDFCAAEGDRSGMASPENNCFVIENGSMVFGICLVNDKIYTEFIDEHEFPDVRQVMASQQELECFLSSCDKPRWKDYMAFVDFTCGCYCRTGNDEKSCNMTGDPESCDSFWDFTKSRLMKFNGISRSTLHFHIKECEFRFNHRNENLYKLLLKIMRDNPLN